jgi:hypothetical protein
MPDPSVEALHDHYRAKTVARYQSGAASLRADLSDLMEAVGTMDQRRHAEVLRVVRASLCAMVEDLNDGIQAVDERLLQGRIQ